jgi:hypothetical protein
MGLAVPHLERLALGAGHRPARNGRGLASQGLSSFSGPGRYGTANWDDLSFPVRCEI